MIQLSGQSDSQKRLGDHAFRDVHFANGIFVAVGDTNTVYTSNDGLIWSQQTTSALSATNWHRVVYVPFLSQWLIAGNGQWATSTNATSWTVYSSAPWTSFKVFNIHVGDGAIILLSGETNDRYFYSTTATSWTPLWANPLSSFPTGVGYNPSTDLWLMGCRNGVIVYNNDPAGGATVAGGTQTWSVLSPTMRSQTGLSSSRIHGLMYSTLAGLWILGNDDGMIATSPDGLTWTYRTQPSGGIRRFQQDETLGIIVGTTQYGLIYSYEGISWSNVTISGLQGNNSSDFEGCASNGERFVVANPPYALHTSRDGRNWAMIYG